jgi:hypothetical protein
VLHRYLCICIVAGDLAFAQQSGPPSSQDPAEGERPGAPAAAVNDDDTTTPAPSRPMRRPRQHAAAPAPRVIPRSQYSPLAAMGGYAPRGISPWQAIVNYFNPRHLNMGQIFAERKQAWLDNALYNQYFWYSFWVTGLLILSWFAIAWIHDDRVRETWELAEFAADAVNYANHCKRAAKEAITRYNQHVEACNRVIESKTSGLVTPETAHLEDYKQEIARLRNDNDAQAIKLEQTKTELEAKNKQMLEFTARLDAAEKLVQGSGSDAGVKLADRINRLERDLATVTEENKRLKQAAKQMKQQRPGEPNGNGNTQADAAKC